MSDLITTPNISNADDFYELLTQMTIDKSEDEVAAINARLILLLSNHIGDLAVLEQAINAAANKAK